jgi:hypothetical protein
MDPKLIFHLDQDYQVTYWIIQEDVKISSQVTIPQAIQLLKNFEFDLIISDPQKIAILKPCSTENGVPFGREANDVSSPIPISQRPLIP